MSLADAVPIAEKPCFHNRGACPKGQAPALSQGPVDNSSTTGLTCS